MQPHAATAAAAAAVAAGGSWLARGGLCRADMVQLRPDRATAAAANLRYAAVWCGAPPVRRWPPPGWSAMDDGRCASAGGVIADWQIAAVRDGRAAKAVRRGGGVTVCAPPWPGAESAAVFGPNKAELPPSEIWSS